MLKARFEHEQHEDGANCHKYQQVILNKSMSTVHMVKSFPRFLFNFKIIHKCSDIFLLLF
jgi:hypothetical protein